MRQKLFLPQKSILMQFESYIVERLGLNISTYTHILSALEILTRNRKPINSGAERSFAWQRTSPVFYLQGDEVADCSCVCHPHGLKRILCGFRGPASRDQQRSHTALCCTLLHKLWKYTLFGVTDFNARLVLIRAWNLNLKDWCELKETKENLCLLPMLIPEG